MSSRILTCTDWLKSWGWRIHSSHSTQLLKEQVLSNCVLCMLLAREFSAGMMQTLSACVCMQVRGKGLLNAMVIKEQDGVNAYNVCLKLKDAGLLVSC